MRKEEIRNLGKVNFQVGMEKDCQIRATSRNVSRIAGSQDQVNFGEYEFWEVKREKKGER